MNFFRIASQSKLTALVALAAGGVLLGACDSTVEGGGSGGDDPVETSSVSAQGGGETGTGGAGGSETSSVSSAAGGSGPGSSTAIALFGFGIPGVGGGDTTSVGVGAGGAGPGSVVAVGVGGGGEGGWSTTGGSETSGVGGAPGEVGSSVVGVGGGSGQGGSSGVGGGDPGWDPNRLFLFISDDLVQCADPHGVDDACGPRQFRASIGLPVEYQQVGVYSLSDPAIYASYSAWEGNGQECMGEGGSFFDGTIEVLSIDDNLIRVQLSGTSPNEVDGVHDVLRCSAAPPPEESSVLAFFPGNLPPGESGSSVQGVGGGGPGDERIIIDFADHGQSCPDPYADQPGPGEQFEDLVVSLPVSYLVPGVYSLSDPAISTSYMLMEENTAATGGGPGHPGTLTIHEVTAAYIDLTLEGSGYAFADGGGQVPRCN